jgi:spore coat protein U-like protein
MAANTTFTSGAILTAAQMNNLPWGQVGYVTKATTQTAITTEADIAGLSITWTAVAGRVYKFTTHINLTCAAGGDYTLYLNDGTNNVLEAIGKCAASDRQSKSFVAYVTGITAGSKTYKLRFTASNDTTIFGTSTRASIASQFIIEDMGAA